MTISEENPMKMRSVVAASHIGLMCLLLVGIAAEAAELKVLSAGVMRTVMEDLGPKFERATGHKLAFTFATPGVVVKRVQEGETADVVVIPQPGIDSFIKDGKAVAGNVTVVAHSGTRVAVRKGAPKPDISSPDALRRTLLAAKSVTYPNPALGGTAAIHFAKVLERLGIANEMQAKTVFTTPGTVGEVIASGEAEIGVDQFLTPGAGIEVVGPLPGDLHEAIVFAAVIMGGTKHAEAARALLDFLRTPEATSVIKAKGLEPAAP
jgi:molybdate transport system substrate-binding protein